MVIISMIILIAGIAELSLRSDMVSGFIPFENVSTKWLHVMIISMVVFNYGMLLLINPARWILGLFLLPCRILLMAFSLILVIAAIFLAIAAAQSATSAAGNLRKANDKRRAPKSRKDYRSEGINELGAAVGASAGAYATAKGGIHMFSVIENRMRINNKRHAIVDDKTHHPVIFFITTKICLLQSLIFKKRAIPRYNKQDNPSFTDCSKTRVLTPTFEDLPTSSPIQTSYTPSEKKPYWMPEIIFCGLFKN